MSLLPRDQQQVSIFRFNDFLSSKLHAQVWYAAGACCGAELLNNFQAAGNDLEQLHQNPNCHSSSLDPRPARSLAPGYQTKSWPQTCFRTIRVSSFILCAAHAAPDASRRTRSSFLCWPRGDRCSPASIGSRGPLACPSVIHRRQSKGPLASRPLIIFFNQTRIEQLEVQIFRVLFFKMCDIEKNSECKFQKISQTLF